MSGTGNDLTYDVIVVGAGPAGENVADRAVQGGLSVAIVEDELVGGECSYWACMPTKALLRSTAALHAARQLPGARQAITSSLDVDAILRRRDGFSSGWKDDGQVSWLQQAGIDLVRGRGRLSGPRTVEVTDVQGQTTQLTARHAVVIATGSSALVPPVPGLADVPVWTNREAVAVKTVPGRLVIVGGGVVAAEMTTAFARLGSAVTMLARDGVLPANEPFAGDWSPRHSRTWASRSSPASESPRLVSTRTAPRCSVWRTAQSWKLTRSSWPSDADRTRKTWACHGSD